MVENKIFLKIFKKVLINIEFLVVKLSHILKKIIIAVKKNA